MRGAVCYAERTKRAAGSGGNPGRTLYTAGIDFTGGILVVRAGRWPDRTGNLVCSLLLKEWGRSRPRCKKEESYEDHCVSAAAVSGRIPAVAAGRRIERA